jgi:hypothetical protein
MQAGTPEYGSVIPRLYASPDGTVFVAVVPSTVGVREKAIVIDRQTGGIIAQVELCRQYFLPRSGGHIG